MISEEISNSYSYMFIIFIANASYLANISQDRIPKLFVCNQLFWRSGVLCLSVQTHLCPSKSHGHQSSYFYSRSFYNMHSSVLFLSRTLVEYPIREVFVVIYGLLDVSKQLKVPSKLETEVSVHRGKTPDTMRPGFSYWQRKKDRKTQTDRRTSFKVSRRLFKQH